MLKAIAIDDEPFALEVIKGLMEKVVFIQVEGYFTNAFEAIRFLQSNPVDVVFLDIRMPDISGMELLRSLPSGPMVIFTTAYAEHAVEGFEFDAIDYLMKPFSLARFLKACAKAYEQFELRNRKPDTAAFELPVIYLKSGYERIRVGLDEILYAEGGGNYVVFVTKNKKIATRLTMGEAEAMLPTSVFFRIHRSYIVYKHAVSKVSKRSAWIGETELPVSPAYLTEVEKITR